MQLPGMTALHVRSLNLVSVNFQVMGKLKHSIRMHTIKLMSLPLRQMPPSANVTVKHEL